MFGPFFGAALALTVCAALPGVAAASQTPQSAARAQPKPPQATALPRASDLYSLRARRRMAAYLRLRLREWRLAGLDRAAAVVERRLPVDALVPQTAASGNSAKH